MGGMRQQRRCEGCMGMGTATSTGGVVVDVAIDGETALGAYGSVVRVRTVAVAADCVLWGAITVCVGGFELDALPSMRVGSDTLQELVSAYVGATRLPF